MEEANLMCQTCGKVALVFGVKGNLKVRSCEEHMTLLVQKGMQIIDIAAYNFVFSLQDAVTYEERKTLVDKGHGNIAILEANCEWELKAALHTIEAARDRVMGAVESRFDEMKAVVTEVCSKVKAQLSQLESGLAQILQSKESQLTTSALMICSDMRVVPRFVRFGLADVVDSISAVLGESWSVATEDIHSTLKCLDGDQGKAAVESALTEATTLAQKGIAEALQYADSLIGDDTSFDQSKSRAISELLKFERNRVERNLKWTQHFWNLRQIYPFADKATLEVGQQFASLLALRLGRSSEAETILSYCYRTASTQTPLSEVSISTCNKLLEVYFASGQYEKVEVVGLWTLETFGAADFSAEHYWTTLFYLCYAMAQQSKHKEASAVLGDWCKRELQGGNKLTEMLQSLTFLFGAEANESTKEAEKCLLQAQRIGLSHFPSSPLTALASFHLTFLPGSQCEQHHQQAQSIYEVAAPMSIQAAKNLESLGSWYQEGKRWDEAERSYRQAQAIYEVVAPKSVDTATHLYNMGCFFEAKKDEAQAMKCYQKAVGISAENGDTVVQQLGEMQIARLNKAGRKQSQR